jgi:hypothetical protein
MSTRNEYEERYGWWKNELASLGLVLKKRNEFNNLEELCSLAENIKQTFIHDYVGSNKMQIKSKLKSIPTFHCNGLLSGVLGQVQNIQSPLQFE